MGQTITLETEGKILEINRISKKVSFISLFLTLVLLLSLISGLAFGVGFLIGKITINQPAAETTRKEPTIVDQKNGNSLFSDPSAKFQVVFPSSWKAEGKKSGPGGAIFQSDNASVEFSLVVDQPLVLSSEQKAGVEKTGKIELKINQEKVSATEYRYKGGNFLTTGSLATTGKKPKVTFLIKASDQENYDLSKTLVQSFTFTQ